MTGAARHAARSSPGPLARGLAQARRHWVMLVLLGLAALLRVIVVLAYRPALLFPDSVDYLDRAKDLTPSSWHPLGYPLLLRVLHVIPDLTVVPVVQHLLVLATAVLLYALLLRLGLRPWLAALGTLPVLFDAFQVIIEQYVLSEAWFEFLITAAVVVVLWRRVPRWWHCVVAGLLVGAAALVRFDGIIMIVPILVYVLIRRAGLLRAGALVLAVVLPVVAYAGWYDSVNGQFTVSGLSGVFLYGRVANFAECRGLTLPRYERPLCPRQPPVDRPPTNWFVSNLSSPARTLTSHAGRSPNSILNGFDLTIIEHQPLDYANHVLDDYFRQFLPGHPEPKGESEAESYFAVGYPGAAVTDLTKAEAAGVIAADFGGPRPSANAGLDRFLRRYQQVVYTPGPLFGALLLLGMAALAGAGRARTSRRRAECLTLLLSSILPFLFAVGTSQFGYRYQLPCLFFVGPLAVLSLAMIWPRLRSDRWEGRDKSGPAHVAEERAAATTEVAEAAPATAGAAVGG
ncbi:MAG TPA: phospholipid carrier-dependent glycosyltransferase [Acidimicrobiales bacterium]|nr:phospholipid carrier-dependent glycosyltransferase [Acidimicrobiales bacterium]